MCPPGVDQTMRGRQRWHILAPALEQVYNIDEDICSLSRSSRADLTTMLSGNITWDAFDKLAVRQPADAKDLRAVLSKLPPPKTAQASPLESLPNEMLAMIMDDDALSPSDIIALGVCSSALWTQCLSHVRKSVSRGPWKGTPLICTGTYLTTLPPTIHGVSPSLKEAEERWYALPPIAPGTGMRGNPRSGMCPARRWNWNAVGGYGTAKQSRDAEWHYAFDCAVSRSLLGVSSILARGLTLAVDTKKPKTGSRWILRNHNNKQYVNLRYASTFGKDPVPHVKGLPDLTLDNALLMRICWTSLENYRRYRPVDEQILQGRWAGHRFDVVGADDVAIALKDWEDVTGEIVREWKAWKSQSERDR